MTDAKAKHLGRACALACKLAASVEGLYRLKSDLYAEIQAIAGDDVARAFVNCIMTDCWPTHGLGKLFGQLVEKFEGGQK